MLKLAPPDLRRRASVALGLTAVACLLALLWADGYIAHSGAAAAAWFSELPTAIVFVVHFGFWSFYVAALAIFVVGLLQKRRELISVSALYVLAQLVVSVVLVRLLKILLGRPRPYAGTVEWQFLSLESTFHSFPSGHSADVFVGVALLDSCVKQWSLKALGLFLAVVTMAARIVQNQHYLSDVAVGACLGYVGTLLLLKLILRYTSKPAATTVEPPR